MSPFILKLILVPVIIGAASLAAAAGDQRSAAGWWDCRLPPDR